MLPAGCDDAPRVHLPYGPHPRQLGDLRLPPARDPTRWPSCSTAAAGSTPSPGADGRPRRRPGGARLGRVEPRVPRHRRGRGVARHLRRRRRGDRPPRRARRAAGPVPGRRDRLLGGRHPGPVGGVARDAVVPLAAVVAQAPPTDLEARARRGGSRRRRAGAAGRAARGGAGALPGRVARRAAAPGRPVPRRPGRGRPDGRPGRRAGATWRPARAGGDRAALVLRSGDDHGVHLDPRSVAWHAALAGSSRGARELRGPQRRARARRGPAPRSVPPTRRALQRRRGRRGASLDAGRHGGHGAARAARRRRPRAARRGRRRGHGP